MVDIAEGERNYHIFYQMLTDPQIVGAWSLPPASELDFLSAAGAVAIVDGVSDAKEFLAMRRALERARAVAWSDGQSDVSPATDERESRRANWTTSTPPQWRVGAGILCDAVLGAVPVGEEGSALTDAASALAYAAARGRGREWSRRRANPGDAAL